MPINRNTPGVYVTELSSLPPSIPGAPTSQTAFIDFFQQGPAGEAQLLNSWADFAGAFGGLDQRSESSYQIQQYFANGGSVAYAIRVVPANAATATINLSAAPTGTPIQQSRLTATANSPGSWGNHLQVAVVAASAPGEGFKLALEQVDNAGIVTQSETFANLSFDPQSPTYCVQVVNASSALITLMDLGSAFPEPFLGQAANPEWQNFQGGSDGSWDTANQEFSKALISQLTDDSSALSKLAGTTVNLVCLPATATMNDAEARNVMAAAQQYCQANRAFYIVDIPDSSVIPNPQAMVAWFTAHAETLQSSNAALYYPRLTVPDPLNANTRREVGTSGAMAGIYASIDQREGVWKAPAGILAEIKGAELVYALNDSESGLLSALGINAIRQFPIYGVVSWGARTLQGGAFSNSDWKYVPVRRLALYVENSLTLGLQWCVFEPNNQALWSMITQSVSAFFQSLYQQGALVGSVHAEAYLVRCDATTTTQADIAQGIVNIEIGFAPLHPAEFVIIQIQQIAGPPH